MRVVMREISAERPVRDLTWVTWRFIDFVSERH